MHLRKWIPCAVLLTLAGCSTGSYRGLSPMVTSFKEDPDLKDNYYGATAEFSLDPAGSNPVLEHDTDPTSPQTIRVSDQAVQSSGG